MRSFLQQRKKGFTLLLAALVASIVLALGTSIFQIASKELTLSATGRDSQFAFYAADTAAECALYWDVRHQLFATSTPAAPTNLTCDNQTAAVTATAVTGGASSNFEILLFADVPPGSGYCADVSITKKLDQTTNSEKTVIDANGYSVACSAINTSPTALQRSVELQY